MLWFTILTLAIGALSSPQHEDCSYTAPGSRYILLSNFTYFDTATYSTPAHLAVAYGTVSFDFYNSPVDGIAKCSAMSSALWQYFYGTTVYQCTAPKADVKATFTYNAPTGEVSVNETWWCGGHEYLGYATGKADLVCVHNSWTNPNFTWPTNDIYSTSNTTCKPVDVHLFPTIEKKGGYQNYC